MKKLYMQFRPRPKLDVVDALHAAAIAEIETSCTEALEAIEHRYRRDAGNFGYRLRFGMPRGEGAGGGLKSDGAFEAWDAAGVIRVKLGRLA